MLACISQSSKALEETLNTLKYAQKAKMIKTTVRRNVIDMRPKFEFHPGQSTESTIIDELQDEIQMLKNKLK
jgi:kinesin family protein 18/19